MNLNWRGLFLILNYSIKAKWCLFSRLRPDIRALEEGEIDKAAAEKQRLEEKQRESRKALKKIKVEYKSRYELLQICVGSQ